MDLPINQIICGDCLEVMKDWPDNCIDLVLTDPPYGTQALAGGYGRRQLYDKGNGLGRTIANDLNMSAIKTAWPQIERLIRNGWAMVFFSAKKTPEFIQATSARQWFGKIVWNKGSMGLGFHIRYAHEDIAVFCIGEPERPKDPIPSLIAAYRGSELHPHQKPIQLMLQLARWGCLPNGLILDPFCGSGTTCVAAKLLGRSYIGIDISEKYCEIARLRLKAVDCGVSAKELKAGQMALFEQG